MSPLSPLTLILLLGPMALLGLLMLKVGLFPRRRGTERRCRRCNYVVENISSERCPECGSILSGRGTVVGVRKRYARVWLSGLLLLLLALTYGDLELERRVDWYHYKPTRWVMKDLEKRDGVIDQRAWGELMRRHDAAHLSKYWEEQLVSAALSDHLIWVTTQQRTRIIEIRADQSVQFLWTQYEAGKLTTAQVDQFFRQIATNVPWKFRPVVLVGQDIPYEVENSSSLPNLPSKGWWMKVGLVEDPAGAEIVEGHFSSNACYSRIIPHSANATAGMHEVEIRYFVECYHQPFPHTDQAATQTPVWRGEFVHRGKVKVLAERSDEYLKLLDAPELTNQVKAAVSLDQFKLEASNTNIRIGFSYNSAPTNLAFDVFARHEGKEYAVTDLVIEKGVRGSETSYLSAPEGLGELANTKVDVILRSNPELAGKSVGFMEVWKGEVVLKDVPLNSKPQ